MVASDSFLSREAVLWGYRLFLDREPESEDVVDGKVKGTRNSQDLRREFMASDEFRQKNQTLYVPALAGDEPPMCIEHIVSETDLEALFRHIQDTWQHLGETEPHWSVLTHQQFMQSNFQNTKGIFYDSGRMNVGQLLRTLERCGIEPGLFKLCLEYGCGVGRVTRWLAEKFDRVFAYDISESHLHAAQNYLAAEGIQNVTLSHIKLVRDIDKLPKVDLVYSVIVLQHNPPPIIEMIIRELIRSLNSGGVAYFQVPTYRLGYRFSLKEYLGDEATRQDMEMHILPQNRIFEIVKQENCKVIEVVEDAWTGSMYKAVSNSFLVRKESDGISN